MDQEGENGSDASFSAHAPPLSRLSSIRRRTMVRQAVTSMTDAPLYVILDFRLVPSMDATAARTFATLANSLYSRGIQVCSPGANNAPVKAPLS